MGLMNKFKNLFTDEEIIEEEEEIEEPVKVREIKKEEPKEINKLPTFMREKIEKEEKEEFKPDFSISREINENRDHNTLPPQDKNIIPPSSQTRINNNFKFPIDLEENDFTEISRVNRQAMRAQKEIEVKPTKPKGIEIKKENKEEKKVKDLYKDKKQSQEKPKVFKATPIISPIYGVLDKNYKKEELDPIKGDNYESRRPSKNVDFDSVRKKAYGSLTNEIKENLMCENCEYLKKAKSCKKDNYNDNLMYEALCEKEEDITLDEATENYFDYGVEYKRNNVKSEKDDHDEIKINNNGEESELQNKTTNKIPPVKSSINLLSTLKKSMGSEENQPEVHKEENKNLELTDDLFNLIDSMYEEGKE